MKYTEQATLFACSGDSLLGILAKPETPAQTGVVVIVGGPQYRVGSHRQFVLLSRTLAAAGYAVLRFDCRGMGDSQGQQRDFEAVSADIAAAIGVLHDHMPMVNRVALWGLCDGASAALLYCHETHDARVSGLCLLNPWVRSDASLARTQVKHYYMQRLMQKEFWAKLLRGGVAWKALPGLVDSVHVALTGTVSTEATTSAVKPSTLKQQPFQRRMAAALDCFPGGVLLLLSGDDYTAKEFLEYAGKDVTWKKALMHPRLVRHDLQEADHTFSSNETRDLVMTLTLRWLETDSTAGPTSTLIAEDAG